MVVPLLLRTDFSFRRLRSLPRSSSRPTPEQAAVTKNAPRMRRWRQIAVRLALGAWVVAGVLVLLAAIGIYASVAYSVSLRRREFVLDWHWAVKIPWDVLLLLARTDPDRSIGHRGLSMFVRQASRAADFHRYLSGWHRRAWWKALLTPFVRRFWRHRGRCLHKPGEHWCRSRDTEMKVPPLGPVQT